MDYNSIPKAEQGNVLHMFWSLLKRQEDLARDGDILDKIQVEAGYQLWNRCTGDNKEPHWIAKP